MFRLLLFAAFALPASAEFLQIEMRYGGMSCASCLRSVRASLGKHRAVAKVEAPADRPAVLVELKPENTLTLEEMRDILKGVGFTPEEAVVTAAGRIAGGMFEPSLLKSRYRLVEPAADAAAVIVEGVVPASEPALRATRITQQ